MEIQYDRNRMYSYSTVYISSSASYLDWILILKGNRIYIRKFPPTLTIGLITAHSIPNATPESTPNDYEKVLKSFTRRAEYHQENVYLAINFADPILMLRL